MTLAEELVAWLADLEDHRARRRTGQADAGEYEALMARKAELLERIRTQEGQ